MEMRVRLGGMRDAPRDLEELLDLGRLMEARPETSRCAAEDLLRVRDRGGAERPLRANAVQRAFERECGRQNIVLKARQMGITTWVAGRFFLKTITARGVMTGQGARTRGAPGGIVRILERFWESLPAEVPGGRAARGKADAGSREFTAAGSR